MDLGRLLKWIVILALVVFAWKVVWPWVQKESGGVGGKHGASATDSACVKAAERASLGWGDGLSRFVNPPYDLSAWDSHRDRTYERISSAQSACNCEKESCRKAKEAMNDLRAIVSDMDGAIRNGGPPPDGLVQKQESVDSMIDDAREEAAKGN